jgi:dipeptidyl aminopeptidase/acylaminoacyl peptidase
VKRSSNFVSALLGLLLLSALGVGLAAILRGASSATSGPSVSPLATAIVLQSPLTTPTPINTPSPAPTATPVVIPPPPNWPTDQPWPPTPATPIPPTPTLLLPTRSPVPTSVGAKPSNLDTLYYVANNNGSPEFRMIEIDRQGKKWSETAALANLTAGELIPTELHLSPNGEYLAAETFGMASPLLITKLSSGQTWCPLGDLQKCVGGFDGWISNNQLLFRPHAGTQLEDVVLGGAVIVNIDTGEYKPLDLPFSSDRTYAFASNVSQNLDNTKLVYSVTYSENGKEISEIWTMRVDGQDKQLIRKVEGGGFTLAWSPSGKQLVYLFQPGTGRSTTDPYELWLLNADGSNEKLLVRGQCYDPVWSPDARYVAFAQADNLDLYFSDWRKPGTNIYVADTTTGYITKISSFKGRNNYSPTWSPNGKSVAFVSVIPVGEPEMYGPGPIYVEVWIASADGSQLHAVSGTANWRSSLAWAASESLRPEK